MIAVADTSPLCYLVLIGAEEVLPSLFGQVLIPGAVRAELEKPGAPPEVRQWIGGPPAWVEIMDSPMLEFGAEFQGLHRGETEALLLARAKNASVILLDDHQARRAAERLGIPVMGLLGVLRIAAERGLIDLTEALSRLSQTNFRVSPALLKQVLPGG